MYVARYKERDLGREKVLICLEGSREGKGLGEIVERGVLDGREERYELARRIMKSIEHEAEMASTANLRSGTVRASGASPPTDGTRRFVTR